MTKELSHEMYEGKLTLVCTKTYSNGAVSKSYLDASGFPFHTDWVKPLPTAKKAEPTDVIEHREVALYKHHYGL